MSLLNEIVKKRQKSFKQRFSEAQLRAIKQKMNQAEKPRRFFSAVTTVSPWAIIAEIKMRSPSKGILMPKPEPELWAKRYERGGAAAISVVTEENYFSGNPDWIADIKQHSKLPVLRKDFLTTEEEVLESRAIQADAVLLIAAILNQSTLNMLVEKTLSLGMEPLVEIHDEKEAEMAMQTPTRLIGINNRNLNDFSVNLETTKRLLPLVKNRHVVCESGIFSVKEIKELYASGVKAFLVGEALLTSANPEATLNELRGV